MSTTMTVAPPRSHMPCRIMKWYGLPAPKRWGAMMAEAL
jgi:hypothetical protein